MYIEERERERDPFPLPPIISLSHSLAPPFSLVLRPLCPTPSSTSSSYFPNPHIHTQLGGGRVVFFFILFVTDLSISLLPFCELPFLLFAAPFFGSVEPWLCSQGGWLVDSCQPSANLLAYTFCCSRLLFCWRASPKNSCLLSKM